MARVLVTGSRHWPIKRVYLLEEFLADLEPGSVVIHGAAKKGVDLFISVLCKEAGIEEDPYPARWRHHHNCNCPASAPYCREAGFRRNRRMVHRAKPDQCNAFRAPGKSNGTDHCIGEARKAGIPVYVTHTNGRVITYNIEQQ